MLAQGAGRLIRTPDDRGVVAVLDSRLATTGYGARLRASLPPLWWTTDLPTVVRRPGAARRGADRRMPGRRPTGSGAREPLSAVTPR